jgi:hypothetical protein
VITLAFFPHFLDPIHSLWWPQSSFNYSFFSSVGGTWLFSFGFVTYFRHANCHIHHCPRVGRHQVKGLPYRVCKYHLHQIHPHLEPEDGRVTVEHVRAAVEASADTPDPK